MESIAALGLASNIIQIVDFSSRIISRGRDLYNSADGQVADHVVFHDAVKRLSELLVSLEVPKGFRDVRKVTPADKQLMQLRSETEKAVRELQEALNKARIDKKGKHQKWQSVRQALVSVRSEKQISALVARLDRIREQVDTAVLISIRASLDEKPYGKTPDNTDKRSDEAPFETGRVELLSNVYRSGWRPSSPRDIAAFSAQMSSLTSSNLETWFQKSILALLHFQVMPDREDCISKAHSRTFEWLLDNDRSSGDPNIQLSVKHWLQEPEGGMYWVTGKPGSGKSTLMKYLYHHPSLSSLLSAWADSKPLMTAGFYFWNSGSTIQMSLSGLLRTLLHTCFSQDMSLIFQTMPERWDNFRTFGGGREPFTEMELSRILDQMLSDTSRRFFFLIDGLDEFEGEPNRIIQFVLGSASSNVKLCVASRPWLAFEDAFSHKPNLLLEDLTKEDITTYVSSHFTHNAHFADLYASDGDAASALLRDVVSKASGVFLWVYLVVQSLLEGLQNADRVSDLQSRLDALPERLEDLFSNLLGRLSSDYFRQACAMFRLLRAFRNISTDGGPPLVALFLADDHDVKSSLESDERRFEPYVRLEAIMRRRLNARCKGFLEISETKYKVHRVGYLHRTARDFIESESYWPLVQETTDNDSFEPDKIWANALLWLQRTSYHLSGGSDLGEFVQCMRLIERRTGIVQQSYFDAWYYNRRHRHDNSPMAYNTEMLGFWYTSDSPQYLDAYMCSLLTRMEPRYRRTHGLKFTDTIIRSPSTEYELPLLQATYCYYRIPRIVRWLQSRPQLPAYR